VTVTLLDTTGRRIPLLAGSSIGHLRSRKTSACAGTLLPAGRSVVILRYGENSRRRPAKVKLVGSDSTGERITLLLAVRR